MAAALLEERRLGIGPEVRKDDGRVKESKTATDGDTLSRISEGSNEAGSVVSSYFSAISGAVGGGSAGRIGPGDLTPAKDKCAVRSSASVPGSNLEDQAAFREIVKAFVEIGVRGRLVEALRGDGRAQPVVFRLSREVDAFEIGPEPGRGHRVALTEASSFASVRRWVSAASISRACGQHSFTPAMDIVSNRS
eukprot:s1078_g11.t1